MITDPTLVRIGEAAQLHHHRGTPTSRRPLPSLHLNLADCYRKLGDVARAREHLHHARAGIDTLGDDEYGQLIRNGLNTLTQQLTTP